MAGSRDTKIGDLMKIIILISMKYVLTSDHNVMINGNDGGVYKTLNVFKDTVDWVSLNNGYNTTQLYVEQLVKMLIQK